MLIYQIFLPQSIMPRCCLLEGGDHMAEAGSSHRQSFGSGIKDPCAGGDPLSKESDPLSEGCDPVSARLAFVSMGTPDPFEGI